MKFRIYTAYLLLICLVSCLGNPEEPFIPGARFDQLTRELAIDFSGKPDTSLRQVIHFSGVRRSGYGLLINIDHSISDQAISDLQEKFKKLDINAVHTYSVNSEMGADTLTLIATEGAKFTWTFPGKTSWSGKDSMAPFELSLKKSLQSGGILVVSR